MNLDIEVVPPCGQVITRKKKRENSIDLLDELRQTIIDMVLEKIPVELDTIYDRLMHSNQIKDEYEEKWTGCRTTIYYYMQYYGITYRPRITNYYTSIRDSEFNLSTRNVYIQRFRDFQDQNRQFVFIDESWVRETDINFKAWSDGKTKGLENTEKKKKGRAWVFLAAGGPGIQWVRESIKIWKADSTKGDYHGNCDSELYHKWVKEALLPNVPYNSVLIHDQASYHRKISDETKILRNGNKEEFVDYLVANKFKVLKERHDRPDQMITFTKEMYIADTKHYSKLRLKNMLEELKSKKNLEEEKVVNKLTKEYNEHMKRETGIDYCISFLELPVAHPELNPIELLWGQIKKYVRKHNLERNLEAVKDLAIEYTKIQDNRQMWDNTFNHSLKYYAYWEEHCTDHDLKEATSGIKENETAGSD